MLRACMARKVRTLDAGHLRVATHFATSQIIEPPNQCSESKGSFSSTQLIRRKQPCLAHVPSMGPIYCNRTAGWNRNYRPSGSSAYPTLAIGAVVAKRFLIRRMWFAGPRYPSMKRVMDDLSSTVGSSTLYTCAVGQRLNCLLIFKK